MNKVINRGREWDWMDSLSIQDYQEKREQFIRLAEALISSKYKFKPQRKAIAAKMFIRWLEKKKH